MRVARDEPERRTASLAGLENACCGGEDARVMLSLESPYGIKAVVHLVSHPLTITA